MARTTNINNFLKPATEVRDYDHASRTFLANAYALAPRLRSLYLCVFNFAPEVARKFANEEKIELPLLVKSVDLPSYSISTDTHNQYNKTVYSQNKIQYTDVNVMFHDDASELVIKMWYEYMTHYYLDSLYESTDFSVRDRYSDIRTKSEWGFARGAGKFFSSIDLYTLHGGRFSEYKCMNPIISNFKHGQHAAGDFTPLEHSMTFSYESVLYASGITDNNNPKTFLNGLHYNSAPSPLGNANPPETGSDYTPRQANRQDIPGTNTRTININSNISGFDSSVGGAGFDQQNQSNLQEQKIPGAGAGNQSSLSQTLNQAANVRSNFNEVTPAVSRDTNLQSDSNKFNVANVNPNTQVGSDDLRYNKDNRVRSNGSSTGNSKFKGVTTEQDVNVANGFAIPSNNGSPAHPNKVNQYNVAKDSNQAQLGDGTNTVASRHQKLVETQARIKQLNAQYNDLPDLIKESGRGRDLLREHNELIDYYNELQSGPGASQQRTTVTPNPRDLDQTLGGDPVDGNISSETAFSVPTARENTARNSLGPEVGDTSVDLGGSWTPPVDNTDQEDSDQTPSAI